MGAPRTPAQITAIVIHCSASPNGQKFGANDIDMWHRRRGFKRDPAKVNSLYPLKHIGYHFVIQLDGTVQNGRDPLEVGAHAQGRNHDSLGICLIGTDKFTAVQWVALANLVNALEAAYPIQDIVGHRDLSPDLNGDGVITSNEYIKTCPGFTVANWLKDGKRIPLEHVYQVTRGMVEKAAAPIPTPAPVTQTPLTATDSKPWWQSTTIQGAIIAALPSLSHLVGIDYALLSPYANDIATIFGTVIVIIGRKYATTTIR